MHTGIFCWLLLVFIRTVRSQLSWFENCTIVPRQCPNDNITFHLYTRTTQESPTDLDMNRKEEIKSADFVNGNPLIILIHGYTGHRDYAPNNYIRPAYFERGEFNVISVDYGEIAQEPCYVQAVLNLKTVANCTAQLINYLVDENLFEMDSIHVIGFSLGAQTSGMISNYLTSERKLKRITALDPAKPLFVTAASQDRLDKDDADFVDVIHTDVFQRGILIPTGHVDFFVNGGHDQPGCNSFESPGSCNHDRAPQYYAESINSEDGFWGYGCAHWFLYEFGICNGNNSDDFALMGYNADPSTRGQYFLTTNAEKPYAQGKNFMDSDSPKNFENGYYF